jgi:hypothetical protein
MAVDAGTVSRVNSARRQFGCHWSSRLAYISRSSVGRRAARNSFFAERSVPFGTATERRIAAVSAAC